jgi:uncharacterized membrane protein
MSLHHAMHPRLPIHGNQVSNLQHPDKDPLINRVEAFSNGVFAIAITLLALGLEVPQVQLTASPNLLLHALLAEWPRFAIFVLSFILIGEVWVNHHRMFSYIHRSAHWLIWLNLGLLLSVVVIPFATELLGEYELQLGSQLMATVIYGATWTLGRPPSPAAGSWGRSSTAPARS